MLFPQMREFRLGKVVASDRPTRIFCKRDRKTCVYRQEDECKYPDGAHRSAQESKFKIICGRGSEVENRRTQFERGVIVTKRVNDKPSLVRVGCSSKSALSCDFLQDAGPKTQWFHGCRSKPKRIAVICGIAAFGRYK